MKRQAHRCQHLSTACARCHRYASSARRHRPWRRNAPPINFGIIRMLTKWCASPAPVLPAPALNLPRPVYSDEHAPARALHRVTASCHRQRIKRPRVKRYFIVNSLIVKPVASQNRV